MVVLGSESLTSEELSSLWGLVVKGDDGKGGGGTETGDGGLSSHLFVFLIDYKFILNFPFYSQHFIYIYQYF